MKKISAIFLTFFTLLIVSFGVKAQTPPKNINVDGVNILSDPQYFNGGVSVVEATYYFSTATMPSLTAEAKDGQTVLVTQPADANNGVGQVVVCDNSGTPLDNSAYTIRFVKKLVSGILTKCDIGGTEFTFVDPTSQFVQTYPAFTAGTTVLPTINNFKDENGDPLAVTIVAQTSFAKGGKAILKTSDGVIYTLNFSVMESENTMPSLFTVTLEDASTFNLTTAEFIYKGENRFVCSAKDKFTKRIEDVAVTKGDAMQSVTYLYQSADSVAIRVEAENGDTAIYSLVYGEILNHNLNVSISLPVEKIKGENTIAFSPSNRVATMTVNKGVTEFPVAYTTYPAVVLSEKQKVFVSSRPDKNQSFIYVTAESGDTISYVINYEFEDRYSVYLDGITINGSAISPFDPTEQEYKNQPNGVIGYTKRSQFSNVTILQSDAKAELIVTAEDGSAERVYTVYFSGSSTTPAVKDVYYDYANNTDALKDYPTPWQYDFPGLDALKPFKADIDGDKYFVLQQGSEPASNDVVIRAYSGEAFADNTTEIVANRTASSDVDLDSLYYFDGTEWQDLTAQLENPTVQIALDNYKSEIPAMSVVADRYATVTITYAKSQLEHSTIYVEAEDGNTRNYDIEYTVATPKSSDNTLKAILIDGEAIESSKMTTNPIEISYLPNTIPSVTWVRNNDKQLVSVEHQDINGVKIKVTAEDGTSKTYNLRFTPTSGSASNVLKQLVVNGTAISSTQLTDDFTTTEVIDGREVTGYTTDIASDLAISVERPDGYDIQPIMITNYRGLKDYLGNYQTSIVDLGDGGDKAEVHRYNIPITSGTTASVGDEYSVDVKIYIDGFEGTTTLGTFDDNLDKVNELYNLAGAHNRTFRVNYEYAGRWPLIEVQPQADGQHVRILSSTNSFGRRIYTIQVYSKSKVKELIDSFGEITDEYEDSYTFIFLPVGTDVSDNLKELIVNETPLVGTTDINGKTFDQTAGETYEFAVTADSVPFVTFEKEATANGQKVETTVEQDPSNPWKYNVHFKITPADLGTAKEYDIILRQYECNDGKLDAIEGLSVNTFDKETSDYTSNPETKAKASLWPKLNFTRTAPFDAVVQTLTHSTADFAVSCDGGTPFDYNFVYQSVNTTLGALLVDETDVTSSIVDYKLETPAALKSAIEARVAEEGQTLAVEKTLGKDEFVITVTSEHGGETQDYTITFTKKPSSEKNLINLSSKYSVIPTFNPAQFVDPYDTYAHEHVDPAVPQWITPAIGDMQADYYVGQTVNFTYNYNEGNLPAVQTFEVEAEDGTKNSTPYSLRVMNSRSEYKKLAGIAINGEAVSYFDPDIFDYSSYTPINIVGKPRINWSTLDAFQTIEAEGDGTEFGIDWANKLIKIKVIAGYTAADNYETYIIPFDYSSTESDTELEHLYFGASDLKSAGSHDVKYLGQYPDIKPELKALGQVVTVALDKENATAKVVVTAQNGKVDEEKYGTYNLVADDDAYAGAVIIDGEKLSTLADGTLTYAGLTLANSINPEILVLPKNPWQKVGDVALDVENKVDTFRITAPNGTPVKYQLSFDFSALDGDSKLDKFEIEGIGDLIALGESFPYDVTGCNVADVLNMKATLRNQYQSLVWSKTKGESDDPALFAQMRATVYAANATSTDYYVNFIKDVDTDLSNIKLVLENATEINFDGDLVSYKPTPAAFDPSETKYTVTFPSHATYVPSVHFVANSDCQTVDEYPTATTTTDELVVYNTTVTAQNGDTKDYTVNLERRKCDIKTLNGISLRYDGVWTELKETSTDYGAFNGDYAPATKSYTINFENYVDQLPSIEGESSDAQAGDIRWVFTCDKGHETATVVANAANNNVHAVYTINIISESGEPESYNVIINNKTYDESEISMIFVDPTDETKTPLLTSHTLYDVNMDFASNTLTGYVVTLHNDHLEDPSISDHWPVVTWIEPTYAKIVESGYGEEMSTTDYRYIIYTLTLRQQKYALEPESYPDVKYQIEFRNPICPINGLGQISLQNPETKVIVGVSTTPSDYTSDINFISEETTSGTKTFNITMPAGWVEEQLPIITYDRLCTRENISADWTVKDDTHAIYEIVSKSEKGEVVTYRLVFNYTLLTNTDLCNVYFDSKPLADFDVTMLDKYNAVVTLGKCEEFPTEVLPDLASCDNALASAEVLPVVTSIDGSQATYSIKVTAQDPTKQATYKVVFNKTYTDDTDAQLAEIRLNGYELLAGKLYFEPVNISSYFDPATLNYTIEMPKDKEFPTVVSGADKDGNTIAAVVDEDKSNDKTRVYVIENTTCDGKGSVKYTITIELYENDQTTVPETKLYVDEKNFDDLSSVEGVKITGDNLTFTVGKSPYNITYEPKYIYNNFYVGGAYMLVYPDIKLSPLAEAATLEVFENPTDDNVASKTYTLVVTAENEVNSATYKVNVNMASSTVNTLDVLANGSSIASPYTLEIGAHEAWPVITTSPLADVVDNTYYREVKNLTDPSVDYTESKHTDRFSVMSQHDAIFGGTASVYEVVTTRKTCDMHQIANLLFNGSNVAFTVSGTDQWTADVVYPTTVCGDIATLKADIEGLFAEPVLECDKGHATYEMTVGNPTYPSAMPITDGSCEVKYVVTAQDGSVGTYTINVAIKYADVTMSDIQIVKGTSEGISVANIADLQTQFGIESITMTGVNQYHVILPEGAQADLALYDVKPVLTGSCYDLSTDKVLDASGFVYTVSGTVNHKLGFEIASYEIVFEATRSSETRATNLLIDGIPYNTYVGMASVESASPLTFDASDAAKLKENNIYAITYVADYDKEPTTVELQLMSGVELNGSVIKTGAVESGYINYQWNTVAQSGATNQYQLTLLYSKYIKSDDAGLATICIDGLELVYTDGMSLTIDEHKSFPALTCANPTNAKASATYSLTTDEEWQRIYTVTVTAEDGTEKTYSVTFNKTKCEKYLLADIQVYGTSIAGFDPTTSDATYTITRALDESFPTEISDITIVQQCIAGQQNVNIEIVNDAPTNRTFKITSTSHDNASLSISYYVTVNWTQNDVVTNVVILENDAVISGFNMSNSGPYNVNIDEDDFSGVWPVISVQLQPEYARYEKTETVVEGSQRTTVVDVYANQYTATKFRTYTVIDNIVPCNKTYLADIRLAGTNSSYDYEIGGSLKEQGIFTDKTAHDILVNLPAGATLPTVEQVQAGLQLECATHFVATVSKSASSTWYQGIYDIRVAKKSDATVYFDYALVLNLTVSSDLYALKDIMTNGSSIGTNSQYPLEISTLYPNGKFVANQYRYIINLPEHTDLSFPVISGVAVSEPNAKAVVENVSTTDSTKIDIVYVVDQNGVKQSPDYTVEVNKLHCSKDHIEGISVMGKSVSIANGFDFDFDRENSFTERYSITLPAGQDFVQPVVDDLECTFGHESVKLTVDNDASHPTYCDYIFTTTSQKGTHRNYIIREYQTNYSDAQLINILIGSDVSSLAPLSTLDATYRSNYDFSPTQYNYNVAVASHSPYILDVQAQGYQLVDANMEIRKVGNDSIHTYTYKVTSKDKSQQLTYIVNVYLTCRIYLLKDVFISGASVIDGFYEASTDTYVLNRITAVGGKLPDLADIEVQANCELGHQKVTIQQVVNDKYTHVFVITSQSASGHTATYTIYCTLEKANNALLDMISVKGTELTCTDNSCSVQTNVVFNPLLESYVVTLDYDVNVTKDDIAALTQDPNATYVVTGAGKTFTVVVTAENGTTLKTYNLTIVNRPSKEASVVDIFVNYESLAGKGFNPATDREWTYEVENRRETWILNPDSLNISWMLSSSIMTGEELMPRQTLTDSTYMAVVRVTAADKTTYVDYRITIVNHNTLSNNALLADLKINGVTPTGFDANTFYYEVEADCDALIPIVSYQGAEPTVQTIVKTDATEIPGRTIISVTAQDGKANNLYIVEFKCISKEPNHNALLSMISLTDGAVLTPVFTSEQLVYQAVYPAGTSMATVPSHLTFEKQDPKATAGASKWASAVGDTTIIHVVAEDGYTQNDYKVIYIVSGMAQPYLRDFGFRGDGSVAGFDEGTINDFDPEIFIYYDTVENASVAYLLDEEKVSIIAVPMAQTGVIESITRTASGTNDVVVTVTVSDYGESNTYTLYLHITASSNSLLDNIIINGDTLSSTGCDALYRVDSPFSPEDTEYRIAVAQELDITQIETWAFDYVFGNAQQEILAETNIFLGDSIAHVITVKAGDNSVTNYQLMFIQKTGSALLQSLLFNGEIVENWNPQSTEFVTYYSNGNRAVLDASQVSYVKADAFQEVDVEQLNDSVITITVTADDCSQHVYTLRVVELSEWNHLLEDLTVKGRTIVDFNSHAFYYDYFVYSEDQEMLLANADSTIGIPYDSTAIVTYETVQANNGVFLTITVTDRAGGQSQYEVFFQLVPYDVNSRAEVWDVGIVHMGGDIYKVASHKSNVSFALYDTEGNLVQHWSVPVIDPNQSVDDRNADGREIIIPADRLWLYTFYWDGKQRVERGKLMHLSK